MNSLYIMVSCLVVAAAITAAVSLYSSGTQIMLAAFTLGRGGRTKQAVALSLTYTLTIFGLMFLLGLVLLGLISLLSDTAPVYLLALAGAWTVAASLLKLDSFYRQGKHRYPQLTLYLTDKIQRRLSKAKNAGRAALLGGLVIALELLWTGALYVATITTSQQYISINSIWLLLLYSLVFVLPLLIIIILLASGTKVSALQRFKDKNQRPLKLLMGLLLLALGGCFVAIANGGIVLG